MVSTRAAGDAPTKQRNVNTENTGAGEWGAVTHHKVRQTCKECLTMIGMNKTILGEGACLCLLLLEIAY